MIDYEVKIFNRVHAAAASMCAPKHFVSSILVSPTAFPAASLVEIDNKTVRSRQSTALKENFALVTYQLEVYATSKSECRKVYAAADDAMILMNFDRMSGQYVNNPGNTNVYRYVARYEAEIDQDGNIYRRP